MTNKELTYHHGVDYLQSLDALAPDISDWQGHPNHRDFKTHIHTRHKRKYSFWGSYNP